MSDEITVTVQPAETVAQSSGDENAVEEIKSIVEEIVDDVEEIKEAIETENEQEEKTWQQMMETKLAALEMLTGTIAAAQAEILASLSQLHQAEESERMEKASAEDTPEIVIASDASLSAPPEVPPIQGESIAEEVAALPRKIRNWI